MLENLQCKLIKKIFALNDNKRLKKQNYDSSDITKITDLKYGEKKDQLLDILYKNIEDDKTILVIHGGAFVYGDKDLNRYSNYELVRRGFKVVAISYSLQPEVSLFDQIEEVIQAISYIKENSEQYKLNTENFYLMGDSAGGSLALAISNILNNPTLFDNEIKLNIKAMALISPACYISKNDVIRLDNFKKNKESTFKGKEYIFDGRELYKKNKTPIIITSSDNDFLNSQCNLLNEIYFGKHKYLYFKKKKEYDLGHVFPITYPKYEESQRVFDEIKAFFNEQL